MKKFVFSMQRLLEAKEAMEEAAQRRLANAIRLLELAREELCRMNAMASRISAKLESLMRDNCADKHDLMVYTRYKASLDSMAARQRNVVVKHERDVAALRDELNRIMKERKSIDILKDAEKKKWSEEVRREELKQMDEISVQRFVRNVAGASVPV